MEISVELRALSYEFNIPVLSGAQTNRESYNNSAPGMENAGESIAIPQTADVMIIIKRDDELNSLNQAQARVVKSRFSKNDTSVLIGIDYENMNLFDLSYKNNEQPIPVEDISKKIRRDRVTGKDINSENINDIQ